jgi:hypothetical protein
MNVMEQARAEAQKLSRVNRTGAKELFDSDVLYGSTLYESLRERYVRKAKAAIWRRIQSQGSTPYEECWLLALTTPLVWESDLKEWISEWVKVGDLRIDGMKPKQRVPRRQESNFLVWLPPTSTKSVEIP